MHKNKLDESEDETYPPAPHYENFLLNKCHPMSVAFFKHWGARFFGAFLIA